MALGAYSEAPESMIGKCRDLEKKKGSL